MLRFIFTLLSVWITLLALLKQQSVCHCCDEILQTPPVGKIYGEGWRYTFITLHNYNSCHTVDVFVADIVH